MAEATAYRSTFELYGDGQAVLDDLIALFGKAPFVPGSPDQTAYNCGAKAVIEHILARIAEADQLPQR